MALGQNIVWLMQFSLKTDKTTSIRKKEEEAAVEITFSQHTCCQSPRPSMAFSVVMMSGQFSKKKKKNNITFFLQKNFSYIVI